MNVLLIILASVLSVCLSLITAFGHGYFEEREAVADWMVIASWCFGFAPVVSALVYVVILALQSEATAAFERGYIEGKRH